MGRLDLNQMGVLEGTDKSSSVSYGWDYLRHYEEWFTPWRDQSINVIEIGVENGCSLGMWKRFFTKAKIVGIDINPACSRFADDRIAVEIGSQDDPEFLWRVCSKYPPTIVVDDGSHLAHHIIYTFERIFPLLSPGGAYVIEDLDFHFGDGAERWAPVNGYNAPQYLLDLASACLTRKNREGLWGTHRAVVTNIDSVRFVNSAAVILKKNDKRRTANLEAAVAYSKDRSLGAQGLVRYTKYLTSNGHNAEPLLPLIEDLATAGDPQNVDAEYFIARSEFQRHHKSMAGALETLARGIKVFPDEPDILWRYGHWLVEDGRYAEGLRILGQAAAACDNLEKTKAIVSMILMVSRHHQEAALGEEVLRKAAEANSKQDCRSVILERASADT